VKISSRNFGRDRRYPITNRFREDLLPEAVQAETDISSETAETAALAKNRNVAT
jgi:NAD+ synthase